MEVTRFLTIYVPSTDVHINSGSLKCFVESISNVYEHEVLIEVYSSIDTDDVNYLFSKYPCQTFTDRNINPEKFFGRRDYHKIEIFNQILSRVKSQQVIAFCDVDTVIAKPIKLPDDDWDLIFTTRHPWIGEPHYVNLGVWFANVRKDNKNRLSWFMQNWLHTPLWGMRNDWSNHYQTYMKHPDLKSYSEGNFEFDRIVSQSVINSFCAYDWVGQGTYNWDGLKVKIMGEEYNYPWKFGNKMPEDTYIYHLKGTAESKVDRANYLLKELY